MNMCRRRCKGIRKWRTKVENGDGYANGGKRWRWRIIGNANNTTAGDA